MMKDLDDDDPNATALQLGQPDGVAPPDFLASLPVHGQETAPKRPLVLHGPVPVRDGDGRWKSENDAPHRMEMDDQT